MSMFFILGAKDLHHETKTSFLSQNSGKDSEFLWDFIHFVLKMEHNAKKNQTCI